MSVRVAVSRWGWLEVDLWVRLPDGTRHRERVKAPVQSKTAAKRWGEERVFYLATHGLAEKREVPTLAEFAPRFIDEYAKANRLKASGVAHKETYLRLYVLPVLGKKKLDAIGSEDVQRLKSSMAGKSPKTVNNALTILGKLLKVAVEWKVLAALPVTVRSLKSVNSEMEFYEEHDFWRLVDAAALCDRRSLLVALLGGDAGLRSGEMTALEWSDVDFHRGKLTVNRSEWEGHVGTPKGGRSRTIPMTAALAAALKAHRHLKGPRVLLSDDGSSADRDALASWIRRAERRAGLEVTGRLHILRHTFCSRLAMKAATAKAIMELAGHSDLRTTMRYMHLSQASLDASLRLLERPASGERVENAIASQKKANASV